MEGPNKLGEQILEESQSRYAGTLPVPLDEVPDTTIAPLSPIPEEEDEDLSFLHDSKQEADTSMASEQRAPPPPKLLHVRHDSIDSNEERSRVEAGPILEEGAALHHRDVEPGAADSAGTILGMPDS